MLQTKDAYKILGLKEGASKDEIEKRYAILFKKYKMSKSQAQEGDSPEIDFEEITDAYNLLMGYGAKTSDEDSKKPNPLLQKVGIDEKKLENFIHYYKFHVIIGMIVLIVFVATLKSCLTRVDPDINIAFVGDFYYNDIEPLEQKIKSIYPEIKEVGVDWAILSGEPGGQQEYAMEMKAVILFTASDVDMFILDKTSFERFGRQGAFVSLDGMAGRIPLDKGFALKVGDEGEERVYGVDISSSAVFEGSNISGAEKIAAISVKAKHYDRAVKLLELLVK